MFEGFSKTFLRGAIHRSAENDVDRRRFLRAAGLTTAGVAGVGLLSAGVASATGPGDDEDGAVSDAAILNFALNLEYLEAEFYLRATTGHGLNHDQADGVGTLGGVRGGHQVRFADKVVQAAMEEIAADELAHVEFLRAALGDARVARPEINLDEAFSAAAAAAGLITPGQRFDAFADDDNFLLAAFVFEDVGVTAYKGAAPLISNKVFLDAAAGILAVEAYHAGIIRTLLQARGAGAEVAADAISDARDSLDGATDLDQGLTFDGLPNLVPTDENAIAFGRTTGQVLNVVYLNPDAVTSGGFFPAGVNGAINASDDNV